MKFHNLVLAASVSLFVACNGGENAEAPATEAPAENAVEETTTTEDPNLAVPEGAKVFFVNLENGATVSSPITVDMGVEGMEVHAAGELIEGTGHHHIIINAGHISKGETVPADEKHIHYGGGQTSTELELEPGNYTLTLQFANGLHQSYGEAMSATVEIVVE